MEKTKFKFHYAWLICLLCVILHGIAVGLATTSLSCYYPYLQEKIALSHTEISLITTIRSIVSTIVLVFGGRFYKKFDIRIGTCIASLFMAFSAFIFSCANNVYIIYLAAVIAGISYALGSMLPIAIVLKRWFHSMLGTAVAISACGSALSALIVPNLVAKAMSKGLSLSTVFRREALVVCVLAAIIFVCMRNNPEDIGLTAFENGISNVSKKKGSGVTSLTKSETNFLIVTSILVGCLGAPYLNHLTMHYTTTGFSAEVAAAAFSVSGMSLLVGKFGFGLLTDRFKTKNVNLLFFIVYAIGCALEITISQNSPMAILYIATFMSGIGISLSTAGLAIWVGDLCNPEEYENMTAKTQFLFSLGTTIWTTVPGIVADLNGGSYKIAFILFFVMIVANAAIVHKLYSAKEKSC